MSDFRFFEDKVTLYRPKSSGTCYSATKRRRPTSAMEIRCDRCATRLGSSYLVIHKYMPSQVYVANVCNSECCQNYVEHEMMLEEKSNG